MLFFIETAEIQTRLPDRRQNIYYTCHLVCTLTDRQNEKGTNLRTILMTNRQNEKGTHLRTILMTNRQNEKGTNLRTNLLTNRQSLQRNL